MIPLRLAKLAVRSADRAILSKTLSICVFSQTNLSKPFSTSSTKMNNLAFHDNAAVRELFLNFNREEAIGLRKIVEQTLEDFSGGERKQQPEPSGVTRPNGQRTLFRPFTSDESVGAKIVCEPPVRPDGSKDPLRGIIVLCDQNGTPTGLVGAEEVTGYRTSMNVMVPFSFRKHVDKVVIFGSGMQALWHARLILNLRGSDVKSITFVSPIKAQVESLIAKLTEENAARWKSNATVSYIDNSTEGAEQKVEKELSDADAIFTTTPSRKFLFPARYVTQRPAGQRHPLISAIGSWQPDMIELDPEILHHAVQHSANYNTNEGQTGGSILVDDRPFVLTHTGEAKQSKLPEEKMVEVGGIVAARRGKSSHNASELEKINSWVSEGFLVYKSIGVSLTDLTVANAAVRLLKQRQQKL